MTTIQDRIQTPLEKICIKCNELLPLTDFGRCKANKDGLLNTCRECKSKYNKIYKNKNKLKIRKTMFDWRVNNRDKMKEYNEKWRKINKKHILGYNYEYLIKYPERHNAHMFIHRMLKQGILEVKPCEVCGNVNAEAHHYLGYEKKHWLDVKWLCESHHRQEHVRINDVLSLEMKESK